MQLQIKTRLVKIGFKIAVSTGLYTWVFVFMVEKKDVMIIMSQDKKTKLKMETIYNKSRKIPKNLSAFIILYFT